MRALKMLLVVLMVVLLAGCNTDRLSLNTSVRQLSNGIIVIDEDPNLIYRDLSDITTHVGDALEVLPGIVMEGPGGRIEMFTIKDGGAPDDWPVGAIFDAIIKVGHAPGETGDDYWVRMDKDCRGCPPGWRWLGVNAEPFPMP